LLTIFRPISTIFRRDPEGLGNGARELDIHGYADLKLDKTSQQAGGKV